MRTILRILKIANARAALFVAASLAIATLVASTPADAQRWGRAGWGAPGWHGGLGWGGGLGWRGGYGWRGYGWRGYGYGAAALAGAAIGYGLASPYYGYGYGYGYGYPTYYNSYPAATYYDYAPGYYNAGCTCPY